MPLTPQQYAKARAAGERVREAGEKASEAASKLGDRGVNGSIIERLEGVGTALMGVGEGIGALALGATIVEGDVPGAVAAGTMLINAYGRIDNGIERAFNGSPPASNFPNPPNFGASNGAAAQANATNNLRLGSIGNLGADLGELAAQLQILGVTVAETHNILIQAVDDTMLPGNAPHVTQLHKVKQAADNASVQAGLAVATAQTLLDKLTAAFEALAHYPLTAEGVQAFEADQTSGAVVGSGLVVLRNGVPALNPTYLTMRSPSGDEVFNLPELIVQMMASTSLYPRL